MLSLRAHYNYKQACPLTTMVYSLAWPDLYFYRALIAYSISARKKEGTYTVSDKRPVKNRGLATRD